MMPTDLSDVEARIDVLERFRAGIYGAWEGSPSVRDKARMQANRQRAAAKRLIREAGCTKFVSIESDPQPLDALDAAFEEWSWPNVQRAIDVTDMAIGVYEHVRDGTGVIGLSRVAHAIDLDGAILRALRLPFRSGPPEDEKAVQDALETILGALGVEYTREQESVTVGSRSWRPDFVVSADQMAIEVKYTRGAISEPRVQAEIAEDISAYRNKWPRVLVVIYDNGLIRDPERLRRENMRAFGVTVLIVKH